ncbi:MAG: hypothetical protein HY717_08515 [Planctomycetes bacterium]|nr:hypothetical protein [Planctomycetota bacterium]
MAYCGSLRTRSGLFFWRPHFFAWVLSILLMKGELCGQDQPPRHGSLAYGNGVFVFVGAHGSTAFSRDGVKWSAMASGSEAYLLWGVTFARDLFIAVGDGGVILTSADGSNWKRRPSGTVATLRAASFGNGTFVVVGGGREGLEETEGKAEPGSEGAVVLTSEDAATWKRSPADAPARLRDVAFGNGTFIALGDRGTHTVILTSRDGRAWAPASSGTSTYLHGVAFGKGKFIAPGLGGTVLTSVDGMSWQEADSGIHDVIASHIAFCGDRFLAFGEGADRAKRTHRGQILASEDGTKWKRVYAGDFFPEDACQGAGKTIVLFGGSDLLISEDGASWRHGSLEAVPSIGRVAYLNGKFVAAGSAGFILSSEDGRSWRRSDTGCLSDLHAVAFGAARYVAVGAGGTVVTSGDALAWQKATSGSTGDLRAVAFGKEQFVAVGMVRISVPRTQWQTMLLTSPDGTAWSSVAGFPGELWGIAHGGDTFVALGREPLFSFPPSFHGDRFGPLVLTSSDGTSWSKRAPGSKNHLLDIAYGKGTFVAVDQFGSIITSSVGIEWAKRTSGVSLLNLVVHANGIFMAGGPVGQVSTSSDGITWVPRRILPSGEMMAVSGLAWGAGKWLATGSVESAPTIVTSKDGSSWELVIPEVK